MELWTILGDIVILLAASLLLGGLLSRLGHSPLVGYILAGMLLGGPGSLHAVRSEEEIEAIAELGVTLLLFSLGLEFSLERLKRLGVKSLLGGVFQVVITIVIGAACAALFGLGIKESIAFGIMISLSSTAVVLRILMERTEFEMPHGRNSLAVLLTQDIAVVPLALLMTLLAGGSSPAEVLERVGSLLFMAVVLVVGLFLLNKVAVHALRTLALSRNRELTVIFAVVTGLGSAWAANSAGVSPALGAFVAGMLLGSSDFSTQIRADISSLRVLLLTLFFGAVGMIADPIWMFENWHIVLGVAGLLTIGKMLIIWIIFQALGHTARVASATGLCLAQIGEFAFVLGSMGLLNGVISADTYSLVVSVTIVSFFLSALLVPMAPRFGNFIASRWGKESGQTGDRKISEQTPDVLFIGFGPTGQIGARQLVDKDQHVVVIDLNRDGVRRAQELGFEGVIGDATQNAVLDHVKLNQAKAVVITVPHHLSALAILEHVRQQAPHAYVVVRSRYHLHYKSFVAAGAHLVVSDEEQVGECLATHLKSWLDAQEENTQVV